MSRSGVEPGAAQRIVGGVLSSLQRDHAEHFHMWWSTCSGGPKHFHMGVEHVQNTEILWSSRGFTRSCFLLSSSSKNEVHCVKWWMAHYQSSTPKRHYAYSNSHYIHRLDKGVLQGCKKNKDQKVVTAVRYTDASGKKRYKGTKQLRSTETLDLYQFLLWVCVYGFVLV